MISVADYRDSLLVVLYVCIQVHMRRYSHCWILRLRYYCCKVCQYSVKHVMDVLCCRFVS